MEINKLSPQKSGHGRSQEVVVHKRFKRQGFHRENFSVLDLWTLMGVSCLQKVVALGGSIAVSARCVVLNSFQL